MEQVYLTTYQSYFDTKVETPEEMIDQMFKDYTQLKFDNQNIIKYNRTRTHLINKPDKYFLSTTAWNVQSFRNLKDEYQSFRIPKHSGGYRTITAPNENLKAQQNLILNELNSLSPAVHDCAYAYVPRRSCKDAVIEHQKNNSNWFLKIDLKQFFPSCTEKFVRQQLSYVYPYSNMKQEDLDKILSLVFLNGSLPQGAPTSPKLSNLVMIPIDFRLVHRLKAMGFVYTRYADDMLISHRNEFKPKDIIDIIEDTLKGTPLKINKDKVRYGSRAGSNWNLGLMLNKNNDITVGNQRKRYLKIALHNFYMDLQNDIHWNKDDLYHLQGELSYIKSIEPNTINDLLNRLYRNYDIEALLINEIKR